VGSSDVIFSPDEDRRPRDISIRDATLVGEITRVRAPIHKHESADGK